jgi:hypothetical protein
MFLPRKSLTRQHFDTRLASDEPWHNTHNSIDFSHDIRNTITCRVESRLSDRKHHYTHVRTTTCETSLVMVLYFIGHATSVTLILIRQDEIYVQEAGQGGRSLIHRICIVTNNLAKTRQPRRIVCGHTIVQTTVTFSGSHCIQTQVYRGVLSSIPKLGIIRVESLRLNTSLQCYHHNNIVRSKW